MPLPSSEGRFNSKICLFVSNLIIFILLSFVQSLELSFAGKVQTNSSLQDHYMVLTEPTWHFSPRSGTIPHNLVGHKVRKVLSGWPLPIHGAWAVQLGNPRNYTTIRKTPKSVSCSQAHCLGVPYHGSLSLLIPPHPPGLLSMQTEQITAQWSQRIYTSDMVSQLWRG